MIATCLIKQASLLPIELCDQRSQQRKEGFRVQKMRLSLFGRVECRRWPVTTRLISLAFKLSRALPSIFSATTGNCWGHGTWRVSRKVCGQNANRTKCQPDIMPTKGWHFVQTYLCGWHFVRPNFWLAFCLDHLNMFWHFVRIMKNVVIWVSVNEALYGQ